jgi:hypothetical protein
MVNQQATSGVPAVNPYPENQGMAPDPENQGAGSNPENQGAAIPRKSGCLSVTVKSKCLEEEGLEVPKALPDQESQTRQQVGWFALKPLGLPPHTPLATMKG